MDGKNHIQFATNNINYHFSYILRQDMEMVEK